MFVHNITKQFLQKSNSNFIYEDERSVFKINAFWNMLGIYKYT